MENILEIVKYRIIVIFANKIEEITGNREEWVELETEKAKFDLNIDFKTICEAEKNKIGELA